MSGHERSAHRIFSTRQSELTKLKKLKKEFVQSPILALPNAKGHLTFGTDAFRVQARCILLQKQQKDTMKAIIYWYCSLKDVECKYNTTQSERLAIIWAVLILRMYLGKNRFTSRADYDSLQLILILSDSSGQLGQWQLWLPTFYLDIVRCAGI